MALSHDATWFFAQRAFRTFDQDIASLFHYFPWAKNLLVYLWKFMSVVVGDQQKWCGLTLKIVFHAGCLPL